MIPPARLAALAATAAWGQRAGRAELPLSFRLTCAELGALVTAYRAFGGRAYTADGAGGYWPWDATDTAGKGADDVER